jgi:8-oxo-dGTP pyrophosphatase MutT (NUDIX family)
VSRPPDTGVRAVHPVRAAGGVPVRALAGRQEVLLVHRPRYRDWTFPKGKCAAGESDEACALREVHEETGLHCSLGAELPATSYLDDRGRPKRVRWWRMSVEDGELAFLHEVDTAEWLDPAEAARRLTYDRDRVLLDAALEVAPAPGED